MFAAARVGDPLTHDMVVPCGVVGPVAPVPCPLCIGMPVLIEGLPAAHVGCTCVCSGVIFAGIAHPPLPPPPPPLPKGSVTVMIHGVPAVRWTPAPDLGACGVFVGDPKMLPMRRVFIGDIGMGGAGATDGL